MAAQGTLYQWILPLAQKRNPANKGHRDKDVGPTCCSARELVRIRLVIFDPELGCHDLATASRGCNAWAAIRKQAKAANFLRNHRYCNSRGFETLLYLI